ncbi:MAG: hypothetical protein NXI31_09475 [bacterium]|nr:hypothetical protein [bacterium]
MQLKTLAAATALAATPILAQDCLEITNTPPGTDLALGDDQTVSVPLPFPFPFNGTTFDAISICSNGYVWLGIETSADLSASESEFLSLSPRIAVCWDDLNPFSTAVPAGGGVFYNQSATQVNIVWKDVPYFGSTTDFVNCEIVMTAAGLIHLHWEANHTIATGDSLVGITAGNAAPASPLDLSTATTIVGATGYEEFPASTHDLTGTYSLVPTSATDYTIVQQTLPACAPTTGPNLTEASTSVFGGGCPSPTGSWFEFFTGSTLDLNGTTIRFINAGANLYAPTPGAGFDSSYTPADAVTLADDGQVPVSLAAMGGFPFLGNTLTTIDMVSNGWFWMAPNTSNDFSPSIGEFVSLEPRIAPCWMDLNPSAATGGGTVYWTETANFAMGTWEDVPTFGNTGTAMNTFQCKFYPNGDVEMSWVTVDNNATIADEAIVGFAGGFSNPTGSVDISSGSTAIFDITPDLVNVPLSHVADTLPQIGQTYDLTTNDAPAGSLFGATFVGFTQQNIDLTAFGAPGCFQYADNLAVFFNVLNGAQTFTNSIPVPFSLSFVGISFVSQGAVYEPSLNVLGVNSSNGVIGTIGL